MKLIMKFLSLLLLCMSMHSYSSEPQQQKPEQLSVAQNLAIGTATGVVGITTYLPFGYRQNMAIGSATGNPRQNPDFSRNPLHQMRGWRAAATSVGVVTALQSTGYNVATAALKQPDTELSQVQKVGAATAVGGISGVVSHLGELVGAHQQKKDAAEAKKTIAQTVRNFPRGYRDLGRGAPAVMKREALFTAGYTVATEEAVAALEHHTGNHAFAEVAGPVGTGLAVAAATQPLNLVRTKLYQDIARKRYRNSLDVVKDVIKTEGVKGLWKGGRYRVPGAGFTIATMYYVRQYLTRESQQHKQKQSPSA